MNNVIQAIERNCKEMPKKIAIVENGGAVAFSYGQVDYLSGKVYNYLKQKGIGREDFVAICLPRNASPIIAMLGVWKAGAAFILLEDHYAPERMEYILKDCKCKLLINGEVWEEIQNYPSIEGREQVAPHDAAFAIYTSGSTGNPKGVLHEFGSMDMISESNNYEGIPNISRDEIDGLITPLSFIAGFAAAMMALEAGCTLHVIPYSIVKNPEMLDNYTRTMKITKISMSPSLYRAFKSFSPYLKKIFMGGEPISGIYNDKIDIISAYSMSECGALIAAFRIDKKYEHTPLGKPQFNLNYKIVDDNDNEVGDGESGELCVEFPYVRGYINLPELNGKAYKNHIYHTGDIVKMCPDGNMIHLGRSNDMIKINGNRVEPGEVEAAAKKVLGIEWACAKGFVDGKSTFICLYYTADIDIDYEMVRKEMLDYVPYYMIPSYFIKLENVPLNDNGKVDKKSLQAPRPEDCHADYETPHNEIEEKLCKAFETVLELERVGVNDDFYQLGGDSLGTMMVISECNISGLSINEIFKGRTPKRIAELVTENQKHMSSEGELTEDEREKLMRNPHKLTAEQIVMIDYQLFAPKSNMFNLSGLIRFDKGIDSQRLAKAVDMAVSVHPSLGTVFYLDEDGELRQCYRPELTKPVEVVNVTEEELEAMKEDMIKPFKILNSCMHRLSIYQTEKAVYLFIDIHHTVFDGTSFQIFQRDINDAYSGKILNKKDYYYEALRERESYVGTLRYEESRKYFEDNYFLEGYAVAPEPDKQTKDKILGSLYGAMSLPADKLDEIERKIKISRNEFFIAATILAISQYNRTDKVKVTWVFNGRTTIEEMESTGLLLNEFPVAEVLTGEYNIEDMLKDIHKQVAKALEYNYFPYATIFKECVSDDNTSVLYQNNLKGIDELCGVHVEPIELEGKNPAFENILDIEIMNEGNDFDVLMEYATCLYDETSIENFNKLFIDISKKLIGIIDNEKLTVKDVIDWIK